jgi:gliding motility-associated-like protein
MVFGKTNSSGKLVWAKYAYRTPFPDNCMIQDFEETPNSIYWAGVFSGGNNRPFIVRTEHAGNILGSFLFNINYGTGMPSTEVNKIKYISDDEIYLIISASSSGTFSAYNLIIRFRNDGSIVWSKAFKTGNGFNAYIGNCTDIYKAGNELIVLGDYYKSNSFDNPNNKAGIIKMKLNPDDGSVIQLKSFYIPLLREFDFTTYIFTEFRLNIVFNGYSFSTVINGSSGSSGGTYKNKAIKINMDNNFDITKIIQVTPKELLVNSYNIITDISTNINNESCITINNNYDNYFTTLNSQDSLIKTRKLSYPYKRPPDFHSGLVFDNSGSISQIIPYYVNTYDKYELLNLSKDWPGSTAQCMGVDTSYVNVEPISYSNSDFTWEGTATNIVQTQSMTLSAFDITMTDELICKEEQVCNSIILNAPDTICDLSQPVVITAHKNQSCLKKIDFLFDTAAVSSYAQSNDTTLLLSFNKAWSGKIYASPEFCSSLIDSVQITVLPPMPAIDLGKDTTFCPGQSYKINAHKGYMEYLWQDGSTDSMFIATKPGKYFTTATDRCNRIYTDTLIIKDFPYPLSAGNDTLTCESEKIQLNATFGFVSYSWTPAYKIINATSRTPIVFPDITTTYFVSAEKFAGCILKDTIKVSTKKCPDQFFIPNAFSPNRDSKNDIFKPIITGSISNYEFSIYNRWGQLVFRSTDKDSGWDGTWKGLNQDGNIFVWICKFRFSANEQQIKKGTVLLIR